MATLNECSFNMIRLCIRHPTMFDQSILFSRRYCLMVEGDGIAGIVLKTKLIPLLIGRPWDFFVKLFVGAVQDEHLLSVLANSVLGQNCRAPQARSLGKRLLMCADVS